MILASIRWGKILGIAIAFCLLLSFAGTNAVPAQTWSAMDGGLTTGINNDSSKTATEPKLQDVDGTLFAVWLENNLVRVKVHNGDGNWSFIDNGGLIYTAGNALASESEPAVAAYNHALYVAWSEDDQNGAGHSGTNLIRVKKYQDGTWTWVQNTQTFNYTNSINHHPGAYAYHPALTVMGGKLYATWVESSGADHAASPRQVRVSVLDGTSWSAVDGNGDAGLNQSSANDATYPVMTASNGKLYTAWLENNSVNLVKIKCYDPSGGLWSFVNDGAAESFNFNPAKNAYKPRLADLNGTLYLAWNESPTAPAVYSQIRLRKYHNGGWDWADGGGAYGLNFNQSEPAAVNQAPGLFAFRNALYITWSERFSAPTTRPYRIRVARYDGSSRTFIDGNDANGQNVNGDCRASTPALAVSGGNLYLAWGEETGYGLGIMQVRVKLYPLPPFIVGITPPTNRVYKLGDLVDFTVTFNKAVTAIGTPRLPITIGSETVYASYNGGSGTNNLVFRYQVESGKNDPDGLTLGAALDLNGATATMKDSAGNDAELTLTGVDTSGITIDTVAPTVTITAAAPNWTNTPLIPVTITFSEAVTGFTAADIAVGNGTKSGFATVNPYTYTVEIIPSGQGTVTVDVAANVAQDAAGNGNGAAVRLSRTYDSVAPAVTITSIAPNPTKNAPIPVTVNFSESVTGFEVDDIVVTNGIKNGFGGSGTTYTVDITPAGAGAVTVNIAAGVAQDAAGNENTAAAAFSIDYITIPGVPTGVAATAGDTDAVVRFISPSDNGGSPITHYTVYCFQGVTPVQTVDTTGTYLTVTGLTNGLRYTFAVSATNAAGNSALSPVSAGVTPTAYFAGGAGTVDQPYIIKTADQLDKVRYRLGSYFKLDADIDLSSYGTAYDGGAGWRPIADASGPFTGNFDGAKHTVSNLFINRAAASGVGLFGCFGPGAVIKNLRLEQLNVNGGAGTGSLAGYSEGTATQKIVIQNVYAAGTLSAVTNCGGLVGLSRYTDIGQTGTAVVVVSSANYAGGLVGYQATGATIVNSYAKGDVTQSGGSGCGGLLGYNASNAVVTQTYASGAVHGTSSGGLIGVNDGTVNGSYYDSQTTGQSDVGKGMAALTGAMKDQSAFSGWDFTNTWSIHQGIGYPYLQGQEPLAPIDGGSLNLDQANRALTPKMMVHNKQLYVAWAEYQSGHTQIRVKQYDGLNWNLIGDSLNVNPDAGAYNPVLIDYQSSLYLAWYEETGPDRYQVYLRRYHDATGVWSDSANLSYTANKAYNVKLISYNNALYAVWTEKTAVEQIRVKRLGSSGWEPADQGTLNFDATSKALAPTMAVYNGKLFAAWGEAGNIRVKSYDGNAGNTWTAADNSILDYDAAKTAVAPILVNCSGQLYLVWIEKNAGGFYQGRAKKYNGISWDWAGSDSINYDSAQSISMLNAYGDQGVLIATWTENGLIRFKSYNGATWQAADNGGINYDAAKAATALDLIEYHGKLYIAWQESNGTTDQLRIRNLE